MGAQWIHGEEDNPVYKLAVQNNFLPSSNPLDGQEYLVTFEEIWETQFFTQDGKLIDQQIVKETCELVEDIFDDADKFYRDKVPLCDKNESMGTFLGEHFYQHLRTSGCDAKTWRAKEAIFFWYLLKQKTESGCKTVYELSASAWGQFQDCKGEEEVVIASGYQALLDLLLHYVSPANIQVNTPVQCIYWEQDSIPCNAQCLPTNGYSGKVYPMAVRTKVGDVIYADHVIVTCSLGVLKNSAYSMFKPMLPREKMASIYRLGFGTVDKIYLEWEHPWWDPDTHVIQLAWLPDEPLLLTCMEDKNAVANRDDWWRAIHSFECVDFQPNLLCGWVAGADADIMEAIPEETVLDVCHELLQRFTGKTVPKPKAIVRSSWGSDTYTYGSYSYMHVGSSGSDMEALAAPLPSCVEPRLLFAGEATHSQYFSTVHGALLSGQKEAQRIIDHVRQD